MQGICYCFLAWIVYIYYAITNKTSAGEKEKFELFTGTYFVISIIAAPFNSLFSRTNILPESILQTLRTSGLDPFFASIFVVHGLIAAVIFIYPTIVAHKKEEWKKKKEKAEKEEEMDRQDKMERRKIVTQIRIERERTKQILAQAGQARFAVQNAEAAAISQPQNEMVVKPFLARIASAIPIHDQILLQPIRKTTTLNDKLKAIENEKEARRKQIKLFRDNFEMTQEGKEMKYLLGIYEDLIKDTEEGRKKLEEDDEIAPWEEGFMEGAHDAGQLGKDALTGEPLMGADDVIEMDYEGKLYRFVSRKNAEEFVKRRKKKK